MSPTWHLLRVLKLRLVLSRIPARDPSLPPGSGPHLNTLLLPLGVRRYITDGSTTRIHYPSTAGRLGQICASGRSTFKHLDRVARPFYEGFLHIEGIQGNTIEKFILLV